MGRITRITKAFLALLLLAVAGACPRNEKIAVAVILPLSGEWSVYGGPIRKGVELAYEEIQQRKDLPYRLEIEIADSQSDPAKAAEELRRMLGAGALAALGGVTSPEAFAMAPVAQEEEKVLVSPSASTPDLSGISRYFFRVFPSDTREGTKMGNFAAQKLNLGNVVVLAADTAYAQGITEVFKAEFERYGRKVLETITYAEGTRNFTAVVEQVLAHQPEAIYVADYAEPVHRILVQLKAAGFSSKLMTTSAFNAPEVLAAAGEDAEDVILTQTAFEPDSEDPRVQKFVSAFRAKYGETPSTFAAHGYDALMVLADATKAMSVKASSEVLKGMRSLGADYAGVTGAIQFDERGDVGQFPRVYILQDGKFEDYDRVREESRRRLLERLNEIRRQRERQLRQNPSD